MADEPLSEVFVLVIALTRALGVYRINELPGCWEHQIDDAWRVALNGHDVATENSRGGTVPPFTAAFDYGDFPAGLVTPAGGILAAGEGANEETLCEALRRAVLAIGGELP